MQDRAFCVQCAGVDRGEPRAVASRGQRTCRARRRVRPIRHRGRAADAGESRGVAGVAGRRRSVADSYRMAERGTRRNGSHRRRNRLQTAVSRLFSMTFPPPPPLLFSAARRLIRLRPISLSAASAGFAYRPARVRTRSRSVIRSASTTLPRVRPSARFRLVVRDCAGRGPSVFATFPRFRPSARFRLVVRDCAGRGPVIRRDDR